MTRKRLEDLDADAQRRIAASPEWLRELMVQTCPTAEEDAVARAAAAARAREIAAQEHEALLDLADKAEEGEYGPAGVKLAMGLLKVGGRCPHNLHALRDALRQLSPRARRRVSSEPVPFANAANGRRR